MSLRRAPSLLGMSAVIGGYALYLPPQNSKPDPYREGLSVFRKPGKTADHSACASCHAPDALDLAQFAFTDETIRRRANVHLDPEDTERVVAFVHEVRKRYRIQSLLDPMTDRPLQPGGKVLPGETPEARDAQFGKEIAPKLPTLFGSPILTLAAAKRAEAELLRLNPWDLRVGIPFNRISEDAIHGSDHATIAQWFPELTADVAVDKRKEWYDLVDAYLAKPTWQSLRRLTESHARFVTYPKDGIESIAYVKYRALLVLQHRTRLRLQGITVPTGIVAPEITRWPAANPLWDVGDTARDVRGFEAAQLGMDARLLSDKYSGPDINKQLSELRLPWMWLGWLSDQGQYRTGGENEIRRGDWFSDALEQDGPYAIHSVYANARRQMVISRRPEAWLGDPKRQRLMWDYASLRMVNRFWAMAPKEPSHRTTYLRFTANCLRMSLLLFKADLEKTHRVWYKVNSTQNAKEVAAVIEKAEPAHAGSARTLRNDILKLIAASPDRQ